MSLIIKFYTAVCFRAKACCFHRRGSLLHIQSLRKRNFMNRILKSTITVTLCTGLLFSGIGTAPVHAGQTMKSAAAASTTSEDENVSGTSGSDSSNSGSDSNTSGSDSSNSGSGANTSNSGSKKSTSKTTKITISAAGDCTLGSDIKSPASVNFYAKYRKKKNPAYFFKKVKPIFEKDDLTLVNFEGTLTTRTTRADKTFAFKGNPSYLNILKKGSVEAVSFANNHCRDYGDGSYSDTISVFRKNNMPFASYGKVAVYKTKGKKIGMIAVNGLEGVSASKNYIKNGIKKLKKKKADLIIVSMHCGIERVNTPNADQKSIARYAVRSGANLVLGHHPHVLQGIEKYKGAYIVYSLGNFCFGGNTNPPDKDTMIYQQTFTFKGNKLKKTDDVKVIPCSVSSTSSINNYQPVPCKGKKAARILRRINTYSKPLAGHVKFK